MKVHYTFGSVIPVHMMYKGCISGQISELATQLNRLIQCLISQTYMTYPSGHHCPASNIPTSNFLHSTISELVVCLHGFVLLYGDIAWEFPMFARDYSNQVGCNHNLGHQVSEMQF